MPRPRTTIPEYCCHEASQQAAVTVQLVNGKGKQIYLGPWESVESRDAYAKVLAIRAANGGVYITEGLEQRRKLLLKLCENVEPQAPSLR
jgi:hypothetical protein